MRLFASGAAALGVALIAVTSAAVMPAPDRTLGAREILLRTVANSGAVGIGRVESVYDTTVANSLHSEGGLARYQVVRFRPERWLRGSLPLRRLPIVYFIDLPTFATGPGSRPGWRGPTGVGPWAGRVMVYLRDLHLDDPGPATTFLGAAQGTSRWAAGTGSFGYEDPGIRDWTPALEAETVRMLENLRPDSLIDRATTIVLGSPRRETGAVEVQEVMRGRWPGRSFRPRWVVPWLPLNEGPHLLLFAPARDGELEPVSLDAGVIPLTGRRVPAWARSLDAVRARVRESDARRGR